MLRVDLRLPVSSGSAGKAEAKETGSESSSFEELFIRKKEQAKIKDSDKSEEKKDVSQEEGTVSDSEEAPAGNIKEEQLDETAAGLGLLAVLQAANISDSIKDVSQIMEAGQRVDNTEAVSASSEEVVPVSEDKAQIQNASSAEADINGMEETVRVFADQTGEGADVQPEQDIKAFSEAGYEEPAGLSGYGDETEEMTVGEDSGSGNQEMSQNHNASRETINIGAKGEQMASGLAASASASKPVETVISAAQEQVPVYKMSTTQTQIVQDLGQMLSEHLPAKNGEMVLELEPASLGKLTIRVLYEAGRAEVSILSDNVRTLELLGQHSQQLGAILRDNTGQDTVIYAGNFGQQNEENFERQGGTGDNPQKDGQQEHRQKQAQADSFAQQLRLGLI